MYDKLKDYERQVLEKDLGDNPDILSREHLDMYIVVQSEVLNTTSFDESSTLSTTYLVRTDMTMATKIKAEEKFSLSE